MQECVCDTRQRLIDTWASMSQYVIDEAVLFKGESGYVHARKRQDIALYMC